MDETKTVSDSKMNNKTNGNANVTSSEFVISRPVSSALTGINTPLVASSQPTSTSIVVSTASSTSSGASNTNSNIIGTGRPSVTSRVSVQPPASIPGQGKGIQNAPQEHSGSQSTLLVSSSSRIISAGITSQALASTNVSTNPTSSVKGTNLVPVSNSGTLLIGTVPKSTTSSSQGFGGKTLESTYSNQNVPGTPPKSGLKVLEHPNEQPPPNTKVPITPTISKKEPGQPQHSKIPSTNQSKPQKSNLISDLNKTESGSKVLSTVTSSSSSSQSHPRSPSSGTNPVLISETTQASSPQKKALTKMDSNSDSEIKQGSSSVLINGIKAHASISSESNSEAATVESIPASASESSSSFTHFSSDTMAHASGASGSESKESIGSDVLTICNLIEQSGLCGPTDSASSRPNTATSSRPTTATSSRPTTAASSRPTTAGRDVPPSRPSTAERSSSGNGNGNGDIGTPKMNRNKMTTTKVLNSAGGDAERAKTSRPLTASSATRTPISHRLPPTGAKGVSSTVKIRPSTGIAKTLGEKSGITPNGNTDVLKGKSPVEPNEAKSARIPGARAASAKVRTNNTITTTTTLLENSNKTKRSRSIGSTSSQDKSATPNNNKSTRSRPSSTLYHHTASSSQKGILSPASPLTQGQNSSRASPDQSTPISSRPSTRPKTSRSKMGDSAATGAGEPKPITLKDQFAAFSRFGDTSSDGKTISLSNSDKWMKQAHVIDGKKITTTDTSICFKKLFKTAKKVSIEDFKKYIEDLAKNKKLEPQDILDKLTNCGPPGLSTSVKAAHAGVVERLTDTSKYTGSHKERFDASGKGKGIEGRRDIPDSSGYVGAFKTKLDLNKDGSPKESKAASPSPTPISKETSPPK